MKGRTSHPTKEAAEACARQLLKDPRAVADGRTTLYIYQSLDEAEYEPGFEISFYREMTYLGERKVRMVSEIHST